MSTYLTNKRLKNKTLNSQKSTPGQSQGALDKKKHSVNQQQYNSIDL